MMSAEPRTDSGPQPRIDRAFFVVSLLLLVVALALRAYHLGDRSFWLDEALAANISRVALTDAEKAFGSTDGRPAVPSTSGGELMEVLQSTRALHSVPIGHPYLLYVVQKLDSSATALRTPSALASLLAVVVMLCMVRAGVSPTAAFFAAVMLAFSATQVRYAQEVREYSLSILFASLLTYSFLRWETAGSSGHPKMLYALLFLTPFIQYGLVLFGVGVIGAIAVSIVLRLDTRFRLAHLASAVGFLGAGCAGTLLLTLQYQFGKSASYLDPFYFGRAGLSLPRFIAANTKYLLYFVFPGQIVAVAAVAAAALFCFVLIRTRKLHPALILGVTALSVAVMASVAGFYPYGGIRQCLYLAPILILSTAIMFTAVADSLTGWARLAAVLVLCGVIAFSSYQDFATKTPYAEVEDVRGVLKELTRSIAARDRVYVYWAAVSAVNFYVRGADSRFIYGNYHPPQDARAFTPEILASADSDVPRLWLVFAHPFESAEESIVGSLRPAFDVRRVTQLEGATLYVASRAGATRSGQ